MTKDETVELLLHIKAEFSYAFNADNEKLFNMRVGHWCECLEDYNKEKVYDALKLSFMKKDTPPTISDIISFIHKAERLRQPSDNELWSILAEAVEKIKNTYADTYHGSCYRVPIYQLKDKTMCREIFNELPVEIRKTVDFTTFVMYGGLEEKSMSVERNRFLKSIPEIREAVIERRMVNTSNNVAFLGGEQLKISEVRK